VFNEEIPTSLFDGLGLNGFGGVNRRCAGVREREGKGSASVGWD
jgi:hypothetical protein